MLLFSFVFAFLSALGIIPVVHAATPCDNGNAVCYEQLTNGCIATSGTTLTTGVGGCGGLTGLQFPSALVSVPFTYVATISCGQVNLIPNTVISNGAANLGSFTKLTSSSVPQTVGGVANDMTFSFWYLIAASGTAQATDTVVATFGSSIPATYGCSMDVGVVSGLNGAAWTPVGQTAQIQTATHSTSDQLASTFVFTPTATTGAAEAIIFSVATDNLGSLTATVGENAQTPLTSGNMCARTSGGGGFTCAGTGANNYQGYNIAGNPNNFETKSSEYYTSTGFTGTSLTKTMLSSTNPSKWQGMMMFIVFVASSTAAAGTQTQTIGSCPAKNVATFTPVNSTIYLYSGNALGQEVVNTVQVNVASVTGSVAQNIQLVIYVGTQQGISGNNPSTLAFSYTKSLSSGTKNQQLTVQTNLPLNTAAAAPLPFNYWAVGVIATNHVLLNQSSLSGLVTVAGSAAGQTQPLSYTATSSSVSMIALCATASYQSILPAVTTTTTAAATTTVITTSTSTVLTVGTGLLTSASNLPVIFLILLLPAGLFLGITKNLAGGLVGLLIGAVIGELMGILPIWAFTGLVISLIALAFVVARRGE